MIQKLFQSSKKSRVHVVRIMTCHNVVMKGKLGFLLVALFCTCFFLFTARSCFSGGQNFWETLFKSKFLFKTLLKLDLTMTAWFLKIGNYLSQKGNINAAGNMDPDFPCFSQQVFFFFFFDL